MHTYNNNSTSQQYLILSLLSTLFLSTVLMPFGFKEALSHIFYPVWVVLVTVYLVINKDTVSIHKSQGYYFALSILLFSMIIGSLRVLIIDGNIENFYYNMMLKAIPKVLFLFLIYILIGNLSRKKIVWIVNKITLVFIITIPMSLIMYSAFPLDRFVFYIEGESYRFSGFSFELVNFSYMAFVAAIVLSFNFYRNKIWVIISMSIFFYAIYHITKSNYVPIFIVSSVASYLVYFKSKIAYLLYVIYFAVLILLLLFIQDVVNYIDLFNNFLPRGGYSDNGPIFFRMYRHIVAMDIFWRDFLTMPYGIFNGGIDLKSTDLLVSRWSGGSGLSKIFMDLGLLIIPFLSLIVFSLIKAYKRVNNYNNNDLTMFFIMNLSFIYGYLQAGFFNFTVSSMFILSLKYFRLI